VPGLLGSLPPLVFGLEVFFTDGFFTGGFVLVFVLLIAKNLNGYLLFDFDLALRWRVLLRELFLGTLAPERRASDNPIAIACLRLFTFLPEPPLFSLPCFISCMDFSTLSCAFFEYFVAMIFCFLNCYYEKIVPGAK
jgi:hypothetical protein